jgi:hypothetical protein
MAAASGRRSVEAGGDTVIGIIGTIILLPLALAGLAIGFVRFAAAAVRALVAAGMSRLTPTG